jgi:PAT family beta-lactamase induction signal transducer AmpG
MSEDRRPPHPAVYMVLYLPFGIGIGYLQVTLAWLLSHAGATVAQVAGLAGLGILANTWKVLWSPLVDTTFSSKAWFMIGLAVTAASMMVLTLIPLDVSRLPTFSVMVLATAVAGTITAIAVDRLMAFDTPDSEKGRAGGWSQAGNLGGTGLGGGLGLWLAQHSHHAWIAGAVLSAVTLACALPLLWLREPGHVHGKGRGMRPILAETARDLVTLLRTRIGLLACFIMLLPIGSGGAQQVWPAIAKDWGAGADEVALVGGVLSGLVSIPGCVIAGWVADRMDKKRAYLLFGIALSAAAVIMALGPRTPAAFLVLVSLYNATIGFCYGGFAAVTLEAIGRGAAATKYNLITSISNVPILLVTLLDGWTATRWGAGGMLVSEAAVGVAAVVLYVLVAWASRGVGQPREAPAAA